MKTLILYNALHLSKEKADLLEERGDRNLIVIVVEYNLPVSGSFFTLNGC